MSTILALSDLNLAAQQACAWIYAPVDLARFSKILTVGEDTVGVELTDGFVDIVAAGTENLAGWYNDADILTVNVVNLGDVHAGFNQNTNDFVKLILPLITKTDKIRVKGHSRGAPIATIIGAKLMALGYQVVESYRFECPNFCFQQGADWLEKNIPNYITTRNVAKVLPSFGDPVPLFPVPDPFQPWVVAGGRTHIYAYPKGLARCSMINYHMGNLVIQGCADLQK